MKFCELVAHIKVLEAQCAHQQSFMKQSFERGILEDQQREKLQQAYDEMGRSHSEEITLRTLERDQWQFEAQKLKHQFDQKMTNGNLGSWTRSRSYLDCTPGDLEATPVSDNAETNKTHAKWEIKEEDITEASLK